ncbi:hypothetical protein [Enterobacter bugandensis]|uniref:hypothetical protein n=1 Tax=Enterobacter bugandensis TaxID=881260 RepID=UPI002075DA1E|nr:hypothetical protein [Enterobacter bugandensis]MCM7634248.1 hypothetical protein [Enterobacter bugandensis]
MNKIQLPERLYFPIALAAEKLSCTVDDLIHLGASSQMEVCYMMKEALAEGVIIRGIGSDAITLSGLYGMIQIGRELNHDEDRQGQRSAFCFGLFSLNQLTLRDWDLPFSEEGFGRTEFKTPLHSMEEQLSLSLPISVSMDASRLYITAHEMGRLTGKPFTSPNGAAVFATNSIESTRTSNRKGEIIPSLLKMIPELKGFDIDNGPVKKIVDIIEATAAEKGIELNSPDKNTWAKYLGRK